MDLCGCHSFPESPRSREEIERYTLSWDNEDGWEIINQGSLDGFGDATNFRVMVDEIKNGGHICDEDGILFVENNCGKSSFAGISKINWRRDIIFP